MDIVSVISEKQEFKGTSVEEWQEAVGGYFEMLRVRNPETTDYDYVICNEDGQRLDLAVNARASELAGFMLLGDCVFMTQKEADDN